MFRQSGLNERVRVSLLILVFLGVFGCTPPLTIPMKGTMETAPATAKVPLKLGVYYSPDFRNYSYTPYPWMSEFWDSRGGDRWDCALGNTSARLFDRVFSDMFTSVQSLDSRPPLRGSQTKLDAILEPKIESFDFTEPHLGLHRRDHLPLYPLRPQWRVAGLLDGPGHWQQAKGL